MVKRPTKNHTTVNPGRPDDSRQAILHAAMREFAEHGPAGARTDSIARAAGVNKALLHYYFGTKEELYAAALDEVFAGFYERQSAALREEGSPGERVLRYFLSHFEHLAAYGIFARMAEHEMLRARTGHPSYLPHITGTYFKPLMEELRKVIEQGIRDGEFRPLEAGQYAVSMIGGNIFYFTSAPVFRQISGRDPRSPAMLQRRRAAMLDICAAALFANREQGQQLAKQVLDTFAKSKTRNHPRGKRP
jgi:TetR/AcrR family transcriptional regulator